MINTTGLWTFQNSFGGLRRAPGGWLGRKRNRSTTLSLMRVTSSMASLIMAGQQLQGLTTAPVVMAAFTSKRCASGANDADTCFSDGELNALKAVYTGYTLPLRYQTGAQSYPAMCRVASLSRSTSTRWVTNNLRRQPPSRMQLCRRQLSVR